VIVTIEKIDGSIYPRQPAVTDMRRPLAVSIEPLQ
jgi:hypothetical protein